jgi:hypothetical protein
MRQRAIVVSIDSGRRLPTHKGSEQTSSPVVTQERLAQGLQLFLDEIQISKAVREFRVQLEKDLANGSSIESGDLLFDPELKIVRRKASSAIATH